MQELRQSTGMDVRIGPFVDVGDAVTPETGITLGAADQAEALKHNGAATVDISGRTWAAVTGSDGWYDLTLTTADTNTLGLLEIVVQDASVCLAVYARFMIVTANYWDSKYSTDYRHVDLIQVEGADATDTIIGADSDTLEVLSDEIAEVNTLITTLGVVYGFDLNLSAASITAGQTENYTEQGEVIRGSRWPPGDDSFTITYTKSVAWPAAAASTWVWKLCFGRTPKIGTAVLELTASAAALSNSDLTLTLTFSATPTQTATLTGTNRVKFYTELYSLDGTTVSYWDAAEGYAWVRDPVAVA